MKTFCSEFNYVIVHILVIGLTGMTFIIAINADVIVNRDVKGLKYLPKYLEEQDNLYKISDSSDNNLLKSLPESKINCSVDHSDSSSYFYLLVFDQTSSVDQNHPYFSSYKKSLIDSIYIKHKKIKYNLDSLDLQRLLAIYFILSLDMNNRKTSCKKHVSIANYFGNGGLESPSTNQYFYNNIRSDNPDSLIYDILENYKSSISNFKHLLKKNKSQNTNFYDIFTSLREHYTSLLDCDPEYCDPSKKVIITIFSDFVHEEDTINNGNCIKIAPFSKVEEALVKLKDCRYIYQFNLARIPINVDKISPCSRPNYNEVVLKTVNLIKKHFFNTFFYEYDFFDMTNNNFIDNLNFMASPVNEEKNDNMKLIFYYPFDKLKSLNTSFSKINISDCNEFNAFLETNSIDPDFNISLHYSSDNIPSVQNSECLSLKVGYKPLIKGKQYIYSYFYNSQTLTTTPDLFLIVKKPNSNYLFRHIIKFERRVSLIAIILFRISTYLTFLPFMYLFLYYLLFLPIFFHKYHISKEGDLGNRFNQHRIVHAVFKNRYKIVKWLFLLIFLGFTLYFLYRIYYLLNIIYLEPGLQDYAIWYSTFALLFIIAINSHFENEDHYHANLQAVNE